MSLDNCLVVSGRTITQEQVGKLFVLMTYRAPNSYQSIDTFDNNGNQIVEIIGGPPRFEGELYAQRTTTLTCSLWVGVNVANLGDPNYDTENGGIVDLRWRKVVFSGKIFDSATGKPFNPSTSSDYRTSSYQP